MSDAAEENGTGAGTVRRTEFVLIGLLAGASFWQLSELPWDWRNSDAFLSAAVLALSFYAGLLAMLGELGLRKALFGAVVVALPAAALALLKSREFDDPERMLISGRVAVALIAVAALPVPFVIAAAQGGRGGWCDYRRLFTQSWTIVVRYAGAWLFVGVVWLVLWLLWSLLELAGVDALGRFLTRAPVVWLVSGAVMGLALAVVTEFSDLLSPDLLLRLLRLLLPLVLLVELVFVAVLPASGLGHLFGGMSPTAILVSTAVASISLVTIAVDRDDESAARAPLLTWSARGLALLLPVLAGLAVWALGARVAAHGWTPERVGAAVIVGLISGYAIGYAGSVLSGCGWKVHLRQVNIVLALAMIGIGALWLTPLLSPQEIAVRSQISRYDSGLIQARQLPFRAFAKDWGRAGEQALTTLRRRATEPGEEELAAALARYDALSSGAEAEAAPLSERAEALSRAISVLPAGTEIPASLLDRLAAFAGDDWAEACGEKTPAGHSGCLLVIGDFTPSRPGRDALFVRARVLDGLLAFHELDNGWVPARTAFLGTGMPLVGASLIDALTASGGLPVAADLKALPLGPQQLVILP